MPTARRLMNKKAFEEMQLLETRCKIENDKHGQYMYNPSLELFEGKEVFAIRIFNKSEQVNILVARNYTEIEKKFTRYVNGK